MVASSEDITQFMGVAETGSDVARSYLEGNNSVEAALADFFDNGPGPKRAAQPVDWASHGAANQMDALPPNSAIHSLAASRPPSRTSQRDTDGQTTGVMQGPGPSVSPNTELQRAIDMSKESVAPELTARQRERNPQYQPAFLRPMQTEKIDFLPSLLTILHSVPLLRQELLSLGDTSPDYGSNSTWWSGEATGGFGVIQATDKDSRPLEFLYEVQRLMVFLTKTERLYGSVGVLQQLLFEVLPQDFASGESVLSIFTRIWERLSHSELSQTDRRLDSFFQGEVREFVWPQIFHCAMSNVPVSGDSHLYDVLDAKLFGEPNDDSGLELFEESAPILVVQVAPEETSRRLEIPEDVFLDRYCRSNSVQAHEIRRQRHETLGLYHEVRAREEKLRSYQQQKGTAMVKGDAIKLLDSTVKMLKDRRKLTREPVLEGDEQRLAQAEEMVTRLETIQQKIQDELKRIDAQKQRCEETLLQLRNHLTDPSTNSEFQHKYTLAGLAIMPAPQICATLFRDTTFNWWEASYDATTPHAGTISAGDIETILSTAGALEHETMLVYVKTSVLNAPAETAIPEPLQKFIDTDNAAFREELSAEEAQNLSSYPPDIRLEGQPAQDSHDFNGWETPDYAQYRYANVSSAGVGMGMGMGRGSMGRGSMGREFNSGPVDRQAGLPQDVVYKRQEWDDQSQSQSSSQSQSQSQSQGQSQMDIDQSLGAQYQEHSGQYDQQGQEQYPDPWPEYGPARAQMPPEVPPEVPPRFSEVNTLGGGAYSEEEYQRRWGQEGGYGVPYHELGGQGEKRKAGDEGGEKQSREAERDGEEKEREMVQVKKGIE